MAKHYKVTAAAAVVSVEGQERYLYKNALIPEGVAQADLTRLMNAGLVAEVKAPDAPLPVTSTAAAPAGDATGAASEDDASEDDAAEGDAAKAKPATRSKR